MNRRAKSWPGRPGARPSVYLAAVALLCVASYVVLHDAVRYAPAPSGFAADHGPPQALPDWIASNTGLSFQQRGTLTAARLAAREMEAASPSFVQAGFPVPAGADALRLDLQAGAESLEPGAETWQSAWVQVFSFDARGRLLWYWPKTILRLRGPSAFGPVSAVVPLNADIAGALIVAFNGADGGTFEIGPPSVTYLVERPLATILRHALVVAWIAAGVWLAGAVIRRAANVARAGFVLGAVAIALGGALMPQPTFRQVSAPLEAWTLQVADAVFYRAPEIAAPIPPRDIESPAPAQPETPSSETVQTDSAEAEPTQQGRSSENSAAAIALAAPPRPDYPVTFKQLGHFAAFFLLGLAAIAAFPRASWAERLICLAGFAIATECLQWFVVTRTGQVVDLLADGAGLVLAVAVAWIAGRLMPGRFLPGRTTPATGEGS
jgi:VanZ family protein